MHPILKVKRESKALAKTNGISHKQALYQIAFQNGFSSWTEYRSYIDTYWYPKMSSFLNIWFSNYSEAKNYLLENGGYLLTYKGKYFIANSDYIEYIGFNPNDPVWKQVNFDLSSNNALEKFFKYYKNNKNAD